VIVISGDNPITVSKIAQRAGIDNADKYISLEGFSDRDVELVADKYNVFGRVLPAQKRLLVKALKAKGKTVAMTGDGVNDILALKEADTSIAMASGSEAARNVSHLVLQDSNFSHMPMVVAEGRRVINNIQKVASLFLTKTIFCIILSIIGIFTGEFPIEPRQLMLIEIFVIGIPSFVLALESNNNPVKGKFFGKTILNALPGALVVTIDCLILYTIKSSYGLDANATYQTLVILVASYTCLFVLYRLCRPFNGIRGALWILMFVACTFCFFVLPMLFGIKPFFETSWYGAKNDADPLNIYEIVLFLMFFFFSLPLMNALAATPKVIKKVVLFIKNKIASRE
jgi:cation-transporting ATPase E